MGKALPLLSSACCSLALMVPALPTLAGGKHYQELDIRVLNKPHQGDIQIQVRSDESRYDLSFTDAQFNDKSTLKVSLGQLPEYLRKPVWEALHHRPPAPPEGMVREREGEQTQRHLAKEGKEMTMDQQAAPGDTATQRRATKVILHQADTNPANAIVEAINGGAFSAAELKRIQAALDRKRQ